jgi:chemotaxis protein histidine kinase CheA
MNDENSDKIDNLNFSKSLFGMEYRKKRTHLEMSKQNLNDSKVDNLTSDLNEKLTIKKKAKTKKTKIESKSRKRFNFENNDESNKKNPNSSKNIKDKKEYKLSKLNKKNTSDDNEEKEVKNKNSKNKKEKEIKNEIESSDSKIDNSETEEKEEEIKDKKDEKIEKEIKEENEEELSEKDNDKEEEKIKNNTKNLKMNLKDNIKNSNLNSKSIKELKKDKAESLMKEEYERIDSTLVLLNENFIKEKIPIVIKKILAYCNQKSKSKKTLKLPKINNFFTEVSFEIKKQYNSDTSPINLFIAYFDFLKEKNVLYDIILGNDMENIGNLLLYYFSQVNIINIGKRLLNFIKHYIDLALSQKKIVFKNENNSINIYLNLIMNKFYETLKLHKEFIRNNHNSLKIANNLTEKNIRTHALNLMKTKKYPQLMNLLSLDFDKNENDITTIITKNPLYLNSQLKENNNELYYKVKKYCLDIKYNCTKKRREIYEKKIMNDNIIYKLNGKINSLNIFNIKNEELMADFLSE